MNTTKRPVPETGENGASKLKRLKHSNSGSVDALKFTDDGRVAKCQRPAVNYNPAVDSLVLQQLDCDYTLGDVLPEMPGSSVSPVPIIRMFGVTKGGNSVLLKLYGFVPYFYVPAPPGFHRGDCETFRQTLNQRLRDKLGHREKFEHFVLNVELQTRRPLMGYQEQDVYFLRINVQSPKHVTPARGILENGISLGRFGERAFTTYESNVLYALRFMIDCNVVGANWIEVPPGAGRIPLQKSSRCQIELDLPYNKIISHLPDKEWSDLAPFRILSFDIECSAQKGTFPDAKRDPVIQIASSTKPAVRTVFCLNTCTPIVGTQVLCFRTERELLRAWANFVLESDPDILTGYNIVNFDLPYLIDRAEALRIQEFKQLGRYFDQPVTMKDSSFFSKALGKRNSKDISIAGRVQFDMLQVIQRDYKLRSFTLNAKEEVHYSMIAILQNGTPADRHRLAVYCLKDAYLPQRLMDKLMSMINYIEMARVTGVPLGYLLTRGQQIKVLSQLYRRANAENLVIPVYNSKPTTESYTGATVVEPIRSYYTIPIATLDFSSLYPSIMMAHNLCYSTLLRRQVALEWEKSGRADDFERTPCGDCFVKAHVRKGILPCILEDLLNARKKAKEDLKHETDPFKRAVFDGRQLALKISANSVYGFTGATVGKLPCIEISSSVTAYGRDMLQLTKKVVQERYTVANGYSHDAVIVYGDTDSVMVKFGVETVEEAMKLGKEAAEYVTKVFPPPIKLEFEKVYYPYLLMSKKRYAGLFWTNPEKYDKMDCKGIESVRRDNCPLVKTVVDSVLHKLLVDRDLEGAKSFVKDTVSKLLCNQIDLSQLVISKALSRAEEDYAVKQAHVELAKRMQERDPGSAPSIGDRVPYVLVRASKGAKNFEKSEDPLWVLEHNIPLDTQYYLEHQLAGPITRIFKPVMSNPKELFVGEHTRSISVPTPTTGALAKFTVRKLSCMKCRAPLPPGEKALCSHCRGDEVYIFREKLNNVTRLEQQFSRVWTQCQSCQGSFHQTVLCSNRDCPIFYMRKKVQKDLQDAQEQLKRFSLSW